MELTIGDVDAACRAARALATRASAWVGAVEVAAIAPTVLAIWTGCCATLCLEGIASRTTRSSSIRGGVLEVSRPRMATCTSMGCRMCASRWATIGPCRLRTTRNAYACCSVEQQDSSGVRHFRRRCIPFCQVVVVPGFGFRFLLGTKLGHYSLLRSTAVLYSLLIIHPTHYSL